MLFRISIERTDEPATASAAGVLDGVQVAVVDSASLQLAPLKLDFDDVLAELDRLPRCYVEPDGSFVCRGRADHRDWSWEGNLFEGWGSVQYIDLWGSCPASALAPLWGLLPDQSLIQVTEKAIYLPPPEFLRWLDQRWLATAADDPTA